ncbi:hypothetical protein V2I01_20230 [Micromonospora sp. BRA006-A]|nr:hypothetical protein [Micromonospora sp. BRA006-A]
MTATVVPETTTTATTTAPRRRPYRLLVPLGLAVLLIVTTLVLRAADRPDADEPGFLSPVATDDDGASRLAEALRTQACRCAGRRTWRRRCVPPGPSRARCSCPRPLWCTRTGSPA